MAGLLDFLNTDEARLGLGLLAAGGPQTDPTKTGLGYALQTAVGGVDDYQKAKLAKQYMQSQLEENESQTQARLVQAQRDQAINDIVLKRMAERQRAAAVQATQQDNPTMPQPAPNVAAVPMGGPDTPAAPAPSLGGYAGGSGQGFSLGGMGASNGFPYSFEDITDLTSLGAKNASSLFEQLKYSRSGDKFEKGALYVLPDGRRIMVPDLEKGQTIGPNGEVVTMENFLESIGGIEESKEAGKLKAQAEQGERWDPTANNGTGAYVRGRAAAPPTPAAAPPAPARPAPAPATGTSARAGPAYTSPGLAGGSAASAAEGQREILQSELVKANQQLATASKAASDPTLAPTQREAAAQVVARAQSDVGGIQRELLRLPGGGKAVVAANTVSAPTMTPHQPAVATAGGAPAPAGTTYTKIPAAVEIEQQRQQRFGEGLVTQDLKRVEEYAVLADAGRKTVQTAQNLRRIAAGPMYEGGGAGAKETFAGYLQGLTGHTTKALPGTQEFNAEAGDLILTRIKALGTNPSNTDREFVAKMVPQIHTNPEARSALLDLMERKGREAQDLAKRADTYARQNKTLEGFEPGGPAKKSWSEEGFKSSDAAIQAYKNALMKAPHKRAELQQALIDMGLPVPTK